MSGIKIIKGVCCTYCRGAVNYDGSDNGIKAGRLDPRSYGYCLNCNRINIFKGSFETELLEDKSEVKSEAIKSDINDTLDGREATYGKFSGQAAKCQALKDVMHGCEEWDDLSPSMKEALEMIVHKAARILNGKGCNYKDNWHDIAGYATLIEREIEENESD